MNVFRYFLCFLYIIFSVSGLTLVKLGSINSNTASITLPILNIELSKISILGILCYGISFCLYIGVISKFDLGIAIPVLGGIVNICILLISFFILKERLTYNMILGAFIIIIGIFIMNMNKG